MRGPVICLINFDLIKQPSGYIERRVEYKYYLISSLIIINRQAVSISFLLQVNRSAIATQM